MQNTNIWTRSKYHFPITVLLSFLLTACGGSGDGGNGSDATVNVGQPGNSIPNDQGSQNTPPTIVAPEFLTISDSGVSSLIDITVADADNNTVRVSWTIDSSPANGNITLVPSGDFLQATISSTVQGDYVIRVLATDGIDSTSKSVRIQVSNIAPTIAGLTIKPEIVTKYTGAIAYFANSQDIYGYYSEVYYVWRVNGTELDHSISNRLHNNFIKRGDRITVEAVAVNDTNEVRALSPEVEVVNAPPRGGSYFIGPANASAGDELTVGDAYMSDADGDQIEFTYQWYVNDTPLPDQTADRLPAGTARFADRIKVDVTLSDGIDSSTYTSAELQLMDTPPRLSVEPSSPILYYGSPASFIAKFVDADINADSVQTELGYAPDGLTYDAQTQTVSWTPTPTMLMSEGTFNVQFNSSSGQSETVELTVRNDQSSLMLAKSGIPIPGSDFELDIGDFDNDGRTEVLSTNSREHIFTLEFDGESIKQDWLYPFSVKPGETVLRLWAFGEDQSQILVVTTNGISFIESRTTLPKRVLDTNYEIAAAIFDDLDNDGTKEVLLFSPEGAMSKLNTEDWSLSSFGEPVTAVEWPSEHYTVAIGNVDNDPALEIVLDTGQIIDGASGTSQWTHTARFGKNIAIGDVDGDGDIDIVASDGWDRVTSYDPVAQTSLWAYNINDFCSLRLYNIDADPQDELVAGPCQSSSVEIYDGSSGTMVLQNDIDDDDYNSSPRSYSFGDLDNDGVKELIFSTGSGSTAEDNMAVVSLASLGDSTPGVVVNVDPSHINRFKSIGWDTTIDARQRAIFVLPETQGRGHGQRVGALSPDGNFQVSSIIAPNWDDLAAGVVVDSNADGISEAVVGVGNVTEGEVHHLTLDNFNKTHLHNDLGGTEVFRQPEIESMSLGIDSDGSYKAIITTSELKLQVYDIASRQADWTSGGLIGGRMLNAIATNRETGFDIVAATTTELTLWRKSDNAYQKINTANVECTYIQHIVTSAGDQIACVQPESSDDEYTVTLFNSELSKEADLVFDYSIKTMTSTPAGELLIGAKHSVESSSYFDGYEHTLRTIDPISGRTTWKSAPLLGEINTISFSDLREGSARMSISTSSAMYIVE